jgi:virginiamycin B lyase
MVIPCSASRPRNVYPFTRQPYLVIIVVLATLTCAPSILTAQIPGPSSIDITEYPGTEVAQGIAAGPDGAVWFIQRLVGKISRISPSGHITEFALPDRSGQPCVMTAGPDGALWFTEVIGNRIGRITTSGVITQYPLPNPKSSPQGITTGPDGALWFAQAAGRIGRITTTGAISEFILPGGHDPTTITTGPDGALWFAEWAGNRIGRLTTSGNVTFYNIPTPSSGPGVITLGPDGALWFTLGAKNKIGRITTAGVITEFTIPTANSRPVGITAGPDGALWFTEGDGVKLGRITTTGAFTEFILSAGIIPFLITVGPDGAVWFTAYSKIVRAQLPKVRTGVLSHIAAGADWTSTITLVNKSTVAVPLTVSFRDGAGAPLAMPLKVSRAGLTEYLPSAPYVDATIQPKASLVLSMGESMAGLVVGWAEVRSPGPVCGFAIFRTIAAGQASEGTVPLLTQFPASMVLPFENIDGFVMGVAMANLSAAQTTITATVWDESGNQIGATTLPPIPANGHTSFVLPNEVGFTAARRGIVSFQTSAPEGLAGLGLRFMNAQNTFTSVPAM